MPQHIGIVACSAEGAALCYRTICLEGAELLGPHAHPEVSLHTHSLAQYLRCMEAGDWAGVAELMMSSAEKLARAGADFLISPTNSIHQAFDLVLPGRGSTLRKKWPMRPSVVISSGWESSARGL